MVSRLLFIVSTCIGLPSDAYLISSPHVLVIGAWNSPPTSITLSSLDGRRPVHARFSPPGPSLFLQYPHPMAKETVAEQVQDKAQDVEKSAQREVNQLVKEDGERAG